MKKNDIRKKIQVILALLMVCSNCFLASSVKAVEGDVTNGEEAKSGYFTDPSLYISKNEVDNQGDRGAPPAFEISTENTGSDLSEGSTEGLIWTNKVVEKIGDNGIYKITLRALGCKYRDVNDENEKGDADEKVWKNPLKDDSTLTITETITSDFKLLNSNPYDKKINKSEGIDSSTNVVLEEIKEGETTIAVSMSFNENNCTLNGNNKGECEEGIAFDVEASFYVQIKEDVSLGDLSEKTFITGEATSSFQPETDNYYYYEWGTSIEETSYTHGEINWNNSKDGMEGIVHVKNIEIPTKDNKNVVKFSIGNQGNNAVDQPDKNQAGPGKYISDTPTPKELDDYYYLEVTNHISTVNWKEAGIEKVYFYWRANKGDQENKKAYMRIEVKYDDGTWLCMRPVKDLDNNGGNEGSGYLETIRNVTKSNPELKEKYQLVDDCIIEMFENHGATTIKKVEIKTDKDATLINWEKRTYKIDLTAWQNLDINVTPINLVMMLDFSGSMPWFVETPGEQISKDELTQYESTETINKNAEKSTIDQWKYELYVKAEVEELAGSGEKTYEYKPIVYVKKNEYKINDDYAEEGWYIVKSKSTGDKVLDYQKTGEGYVSTIDWAVNQNKVYLRGEGAQTKLEALKEAVTKFAQQLKEQSPESKIAIIPFAGEVMSNIADTSLKDINPEEISNLFDTVTLKGGTNQADAMDKAKNILESTNNGNRNYAILFSDGAPGSGVSVDDCKEASNNLKDHCNLLFTAGIFASDYSKGTDNMVDWASDRSCVYIRNTSTSLINAFKDILSRIIVETSEVTIRDYIDNNFELTDADGEVIILDDLINGTVTSIDYMDGVIKKDEKGIYVEWTNINLPIGSEAEDGWHQTIYVKAKGTYIGGNDVATNGEYSGVYYDINEEPKEYFPQPHVNVRISLLIDNYDDVLFKGESVLATSYLDKFTIINEYNPDEPLYSESNESDLFDFDWKEEVENTDIDFDETTDIESDKLLHLIAKYKDESILEINDESECTKNSNGCMNTIDNLLATNIKDKNLDENQRKYGILDIKFVAGRLAITKEIDSQYTSSGTAAKTNATQTFVFKIQQYKDNSKEELIRTFYETISFDANDSVASKTKYISELEKGYYVVTEETAWSAKYEIDGSTAVTQEFEIGKHLNPDYTDKKEFSGLDDNDLCGYTNIADGEHAEFEFKNNLKDWNNWHSDSAAATNRFTGVTTE